MTGIGTEAVVIVFNLYFDVVSGALLSPSQPLKKGKRKKEKQSNMLALWE